MITTINYNIIRFKQNISGSMYKDSIKDKKLQAFAFGKLIIYWPKYSVHKNKSNSKLLH